jgi:hypothetical protein
VSCERHHRGALGKLGKLSEPLVGYQFQMLSEPLVGYQFQMPHPTPVRFDLRRSPA